MDYTQNRSRFDRPTEYNPYSRTFAPVGARNYVVRDNPRFQKKKKSRKRFYGLLVSLVFFFSFYQFFLKSTPVKQSATENSPLVQATLGESTSFSTSANAAETVAPAVSAQKSQSLEAAVNSALEGTKGDYAFYIKHLKTGESYFRNENKQYQPGSLYKLWVMAAVYEQIEKGNLTEDKTLSKSIAYLNSRFGISAEYAEQTRGGITLTVAQALNQMITISHNYAAMLLNDEIKLSTVAQFLQEQNYTQSQVGTGGEDPLTTPNDIGMFFEKLYTDQLGTHENNQKMIELLKKQEKNNKLPLYLADTVVMAHKTGELGMFSHDAGIVYTPKGDYIIVAFSETESPKGAEDRIGLVSKAVYEYFMNQ